MDEEAQTGAISRRSLLIGGGAGVGLLVAWAVWPRRYAPNLSAAPGETIFNAWLKIGADGQVTVVVPQAELGQGVFTALPQIVADELGADWRTVGVEPAPLNPVYANADAAGLLFEQALSALPEKLRRSHAARTALVLTGGSTSVRAFEGDLRQAGAAARVLLSKAAAKRWGTDWRACGTVDGFVVHGKDRLRFGELAAEAVEQDLPETLPLRGGEAGRLAGSDAPRLDAPAKVDGSANFAGDIRLPGMVFASIRQGPPGRTRLLSADRTAAEAVRGVRHVVTNDGWVAAAGDTWWAADRALDALAPKFETQGRVDSATIDAALDAALDGDGERIASTGDLSTVFQDAQVITAEYRVGLALHAPIETTSATASFDNGRLTLWLPTQAPGLARAAAARVLDLPERAVTIHPMMAGGSFGARQEHRVAEQAALLARELGKPVQLCWSRAEDCLHDRFRPPAAARMTARLGANGAVMGWLAKVAAPATGREMAERLFGGDPAIAAGLALPHKGDAAAVAGAQPPYAISNVAVDHHVADIGVPTGHWRSAAHSYTAFFTESFLDELAHVAKEEAVSFRIAMLGGNARLARCLSTVASLGGWQGGGSGTGQGVACHSFRGSHIAVLAEAHVDGGQRIVVDRLVAAVDCGRAVNPDLVRQQIEGGLIFGMAAALGASTGITENLADVRRLRDLALPTLASTPDITVELIRSESDPGGVGELGVPAVAPAIANAIQSATGARLRRLPLVPGGE